MTYTVTPLGLKLADPGTGQAFETTVVNDNFEKLETAVTGVTTTVTDSGIAGATTTGKALLTAADVPAVLVLLGISDFMQSLLGVADLDAFLTALGLDADVIAFLKATTRQQMRDKIGLYYSTTTPGDVVTGDLRTHA